MGTTRLSSKGQIILPKSVRQSRHWEPGTEFVVEETPEGVLLRPIKPYKPTRVEEVAGCLKASGPPKSLQDIQSAIEKGVRTRHARGRY
jgi:AbrB family looped-hinge helix DNA binding protein